MTTPVDAGRTAGGPGLLREAGFVAAAPVIDLHEELFDEYLEAGGRRTPERSGASASLPLCAGRQ